MKKKQLWKCRIFGIHEWSHKADIGYDWEGDQVISRYRICDRCGRRESQ